MQRTVALLALLLTMGCDQGSTGTGSTGTGSAGTGSAGNTAGPQQASSSASAGASSSANAGTAYGRIAGTAKLQVGDRVAICWRPMGANVFAKNDADFSCDTHAVAVKSPGTDAAGGVTGEAIVSGLRSALGTRQLGEAMAKSLEAGADPKAPSSAIGIDPEPQGYYDNYVFSDDAGKHWLFVEVKLAAASAQPSAKPAAP